MYYVTCERCLGSGVDLLHKPKTTEKCPRCDGVGKHPHPETYDKFNKES